MTGDAYSVIRVGRAPLAISNSCSSLLEDGLVVVPTICSTSASLLVLPAPDYDLGRRARRIIAGFADEWLESQRIVTIASALASDKANGPICISEFLFFLL